MRRVKLWTAKQVRDQGMRTIEAFDIKAAREWVGISQAKLARMSGISRAAIANVETGRYTVSAHDSFALHAALARAIPSDSPKQREKMAHAAIKLADFQSEGYRRNLIEIDSQIEALSKEREQVKALATDLKAKKEELLRMLSTTSEVEQ